MQECGSSMIEAFQQERSELFHTFDAVLMSVFTQLRQNHPTLSTSAAAISAPTIPTSLSREKLLLSPELHSPEVRFALLQFETRVWKEFIRKYEAKVKAFKMRKVVKVKRDGDEGQCEKMRADETKNEEKSSLKDSHASSVSIPSASPKSSATTTTTTARRSAAGTSKSISPSSNSNTGRPVFTIYAGMVCQQWFVNHIHDPYPSDDDKNQLAEEAGVSYDQISSWFINARMRKWKKLLAAVQRGEIKQTVDVEEEKRRKKAAIAAAVPATTAVPSSPAKSKSAANKQSKANVPKKAVTTNEKSSNSTKKAKASGLQFTSNVRSKKATMSPTRIKLNEEEPQPNEGDSSENEKEDEDADKEDDVCILKDALYVSGGDDDDAIVLADDSNESDDDGLNEVSDENQNDAAVHETEYDNDLCSHHPTLQSSASNLMSSNSFHYFQPSLSSSQFLAPLSSSSNLSMSFNGLGQSLIPPPLSPANLLDSSMGVASLSSLVSMAPFHPPSEDRSLTDSIHMMALTPRQSNTSLYQQAPYSHHHLSQPHQSLSSHSSNHLRNSSNPFFSSSSMLNSLSTSNGLPVLANFDSDSPPTRIRQTNLNPLADLESIHQPPSFQIGASSSTSTGWDGMKSSSALSSSSFSSSYMMSDHLPLLNSSNSHHAPPPPSPPLQASSSSSHSPPSFFLIPPKIPSMPYHHSTGNYDSILNANSAMFSTSNQMSDSNLYNANSLFLSAAVTSSSSSSHSTCALSPSTSSHSLSLSRTVPFNHSTDSDG